MEPTKWFKIEGDKLWDEDYLKNTPWSDGGNLWGRKLGGRWCLDYWFKLCFNLTTEFWESRCFDTLRSNQDLYDLFDEIGIAYKKDGVVYYKGEVKEIKTYL